MLLVESLHHGLRLAAPCETHSPAEGHTYWSVLHRQADNAIDHALLALWLLIMHSLVNATVSAQLLFLRCISNCL